MAADDQTCGAVGPVAAHRALPSLELSVVAIDALVRVLVGVVHRVGDQLRYYGRQRCRAVRDDVIKVPVRDQSRPKERRRCDDVEGSGDQHVDDLAVFVDRPVDVTPCTGDFDVGLIDEPPRTDACRHGVAAETSTGVQRGTQRNNRT